MTICGCNRARTGRYTVDQCVTCWAELNRHRGKLLRGDPAPILSRPKSAIRFGATPTAAPCSPLDWSVTEYTPPTTLTNPCIPGSSTGSSGRGDGVDAAGCCDAATLVATLGVTGCPCTEIGDALDGVEITLTRSYIGAIPRWSGSVSGEWPSSGSGPCEWTVTVNFTCGVHCYEIATSADPTKQCLELILGYPGITDCISCTGCTTPLSFYTNLTGALDCAALLIEESYDNIPTCDCVYTVTVTR